MRILYLQMFPLSGSGSGTYARELAAEMAKFHDVAMAAPDTKVKPKGVKMYPLNVPTKIAFTGHPQWPDCLLYTKVSSKDLTANYLDYFTQIFKVVEDFEPDVIHVHHLMPLAWVARFIRIVYGLNYIVTGHGSELPTLENDKRYLAMTREALQKAARIVPNSFWTKKWMDEVLGKDYDRQTRVIPGGVDFDMYPEEMDTKDIDQKYGLKGQKVVLFTGKLTKYKGVKYLVQAAKKINGTVLIVGDGPERSELEGIAANLKLDNVKFLGYKAGTELLKLYYRADVSVAPSVWDEPLGLVVLEAMATKTPVVVTRKGGIPLAVKDGVNGFFVRPRNSNDIAEKVNKLLSNESLRKKMGEKARQTIAEKFTWEKIGQKFERMYHEFRKREKIYGPTPLDDFFKNLFLLD